MIAKITIQQLIYLKYDLFKWNLVLFRHLSNALEVELFVLDIYHFGRVAAPVIQEQQEVLPAEAVLPVAPVLPV